MADPDFTEIIPLQTEEPALEGELPPLPPIPALGDPDFGPKILLRQAVQAQHSAAAVGAQTEQMNENAEVVKAVTEAVQESTQALNAPPSKAQVWVSAMMCQLSADQHGADHLNTIRNRLGIDWMAAMADKVAELYAARYPTPAPAPAP